MGRNMDHIIMRFSSLSLCNIVGISIESIMEIYNCPSCDLQREINSPEYG